ncbi:MAG: abortive phage infection protein [Rheinheimera sp.]|uniref:AIPR family protein n=1 Tax=Arsukibacterium sp. UBA3155 TaxID=1946058 RepID=UPI000C8C1CC9|nr:AIPR family protein [Arsukibacterium sp. UBA3155]MAD75696.1 abortive phage infection protein [Rheinheimera sp.]|tara:strand:- start:117761 stop:119542 length:1782 start_codon:yes stop_codon:yes gene_type:complete
MTLDDFLMEMRVEIASQISDGSSFTELIFCEVVMQHLMDAGMTFEPVVCHYQGKIGNAILKLSGYAMSEDAEQLDLFVSLYEGFEVLTPIQEHDTKTAAQQCIRFLELCANGRLQDKLDPTSDAHSLSLTIGEIYNSLEQVRIFVLTDGVAKSKNFKAREIGGKTVKLEVMDIERLFRHRSEGKPRDELVIDFKDVSGSPLPCVYVPGDSGDYDYALTAIPGEALRFLYEKFGPRLLEANVRSFLSVRAKGVNAGIQSTLRTSPERFMAFNNGIVLVADEMKLERAEDGSPGLIWLRGMQIVNGGQTTASLYFAKKKFPDTDLSKVRVPAKIIVMKEADPAKEESLVSDISRYANSQNSVRQSDLSANKPFHVDVERQSMTVYCPDGVGRWFYERAAGSYNTLLTREGTTPAKLRALKESLPPSRKITKTELAKYLMAWEMKSDIVSLGTQKCFDKFMNYLSEAEEAGNPIVVDTAFFKTMVAKCIMFKMVHKTTRPLVSAFLANVVVYTIAVIANNYGDKFDFEKVWLRQSVSAEFLEQVQIWAREVNNRLHETAKGKMISEWAKRAECKEAMFSRPFSPPVIDVPEVRKLS